MMNPAQTFTDELEILRQEAEESAQFLHAYLAIHETAAQHTEIEKLLNTAPLFWNTTLGALQKSAFIALGCVFDTDKNSHSVARLLRIAMENPQIFTRASLAARRQGTDTTKPDWLDDFMRDAYEPTPADFDALQQKIEDYRAIYNEKYKPIRNKSVAHRDIEGNARVHAMFAKTNIVERQTITLFFQSLHNALWQLFHNGIKPDLREHPPAIADMIRNRIPAGHQVPPHVKVACEAADFLLAAAKENPR